MVRVVPLPTKGVVPPEEFFAPVWSLLEDKLWLAGGSVVRWLNGDSNIGDGDFDLWSPNPQDVTIEGAWQINASPLSTTYLFKGANIQVINRPYSGLTEVLESFDFTARMVGTDGKFLYVGDRTLSDIANKRIVRNENGDFSINVTSLFGVVKYANKGYTIDFKQASKMLVAWGVPQPLLKAGY